MSKPRAYLTPEAPTGEHDLCVRLSLHRTMLPALIGQLHDLGEVSLWETFGGMTDSEAADYWRDLIGGGGLQECGIMNVIGSVLFLATQFRPSYTLWCDGSSHPRAVYPALYEALNPIYRTGPDTFNVPGLFGKFVMGEAIPGGSGGAGSVTLSVNQLPPHTHSVASHAHLPDVDIEGPNILPTPAPGVGVPTVLLSDSTGSGAPVDIIPPYHNLVPVIVASSPPLAGGSAALTVWDSGWIAVTGGSSQNIPHTLGALPDFTYISWTNALPATGEYPVMTGESGINGEMGGLQAWWTSTELQLALPPRVVSVLNTSGARSSSAGGYYRVRGYVIP